MRDYAPRRAQAEDADKLSALVADAYRGYISRIGRKPGPMTEDYAQVIRERDVSVVESGGELIAAIVLGRDEAGFCIENVAVHPSHQGTGLGGALLRFAEQKAREGGYDSIYLYTHEKMTENQELYAHIGYVEYERRQEEGFSRVFMRKTLP